MNHAHHWMIESPVPGQPSVTGQCCDCGAEHSFPAFETDGMDGDELTPKGVISSRFKRGHSRRRGAA